ncbi:MAG: hypothetical protein DCC65_04735 [Planctomycetota bacterium]|nr:MAG: hypothetical protein DCC65_04735 [Planctomycetota bacterium]
MSGYPDSHLARRDGFGPFRKQKLIALIPVAILLGWFSYLWIVSGVLVSEERYPSGRIKAEGYVKRLGWTGEYRRHGRWRIYHESGRPAGEGTYLNGEPQADWVFWDESGRVVTDSPHLTTRSNEAGATD